VSGERERRLTAPDAIARLRAEAERRLTAEELEAYVGAPMAPGEIEAIRELSDWFCRRYPTPEARLQYVRKAYARSRRRLAGG
jgi:hypothetical protein